MIATIVTPDLIRGDERRVIIRYPLITI